MEAGGWGLGAKVGRGHSQRRPEVAAARSRGRVAAVVGRASRGAGSGVASAGELGSARAPCWTR
jgi:hypothetical protein